TMSAVVVGTWLVKVVLTLGLVLAVRDATFYDKPVFVVTVIVAALGTLALDMRSVYSGRMPYTSRCFSSSETYALGSPSDLPTSRAEMGASKVDADISVRC